jgi:hypothetical protein
MNNVPSTGHGSMVREEREPGKGEREKNPTHNRRDSTTKSTGQKRGHPNA